MSDREPLVSSQKPRLRQTRKSSMGTFFAISLSGLSENPAFYRVRVADRKLEHLVDLKGIRSVVSTGLPWSGITPDRAPLLLRDVSAQEVYALDFRAP